MFLSAFFGLLGSVLAGTLAPRWSLGIVGISFVYWATVGGLIYISHCPVSILDVESAQIMVSRSSVVGHRNVCLTVTRPFGICTAALLGELGLVWSLSTTAHPAGLVPAVLTLAALAGMAVHRRIAESTMAIPFAFISSAEVVTGRSGKTYLRLLTVEPREFVIRLFNKDLIEQSSRIVAHVSASPKAAASEADQNKIEPKRIDTNFDSKDPSK